MGKFTINGYKWWLSIAMLVYQRVNAYRNCVCNHCNHPLVMVWLVAAMVTFEGCVQMCAIFTWHDVKANWLLGFGWKQQQPRMVAVKMVAISSRIWLCGSILRPWFLPNKGLRGSVPNLVCLKSGIPQVFPSIVRKLMINIGLRGYYF